MQIIFKNEDKRNNSRRMDLVGVIICAGGISRCMEGECVRRFRDGRSGIWISREFLLKLKKEFGGEDKELAKVEELKRMEQGEKTMEKFTQKFKRVARESRYEGRLLVEEFKREMSRAIRRKLMEAERPPTSIEQWYECATNLDKH